jgi:hypothetical protein
MWELSVRETAHLRKYKIPVKVIDQTGYGFNMLAGFYNKSPYHSVLGIPLIP